MFLILLIKNNFNFYYLPIIQIYKNAGIVSAGSHSARRLFATKIIERDIDIKAVSRLMGHASISMTA